MELKGSWVVDQMEVDGELKPLVKGSEIVFEVVDGRVYGRAINRFNGPVDPDTFFGPLASTMMAGPPELMDQEYALFRLLEAVDGAESDRLNLKIGDRTVIVLSRAGTEEE